MNSVAHTLARCAGLSMVFMLASCQDPLATPDYFGEPLLSLKGNILLLEGSEVLDNSNLKIAVRWLGAPSTVAEEQILTQGGLGHFTIRLYTPPPKEAFRVLPEGVGEIAFARVLLYEDRNQDGIWSPGREPLRGGNSERLIAFAPRRVEHPDFGVMAIEGYSAKYSTTCTDDAVTGLFTPYSESFDLTIQDTLPLDVFDLDCNGRLDDPCLHLIESEDFSPEDEFLIEECYGELASEPPPDAEDLCARERTAYEEAQDENKEDAIEQAHQDYESCLLSHSLSGAEAECAERFEFDPERQTCVCPEPLVHIDSRTCLPPCEPQEGEPAPEMECVET